MLRHDRYNTANAPVVPDGRDPTVPARASRLGHVSTPAATPPGPTPSADEQLLLRLLTQVQQLNERVQRLEDATAATLAPDPSTPSQHDLLEVQLHSARVAAELSRVTVELRAEIAGAVRTAGFEATVDDADDAEDSLEVGVDADVIDLTASHPSARRRNTGWVPEPVAHNRRHTDPS